MNSEYREGEVRIVELAPMKVAWHRAVGISPELDAWAVLLKWAGDKKLLDSAVAYRLFGFNNPSPTGQDSEYGYEVWISLESAVEVSGAIGRKEFGGGRYAVTGTILPDIEKKWKFLTSWVESSSFKRGTHQWLEEHLSLPDRTPLDNLSLDLYLPIID